MMPDGCSGPNYLQCFMRYWAYTKTDEYKAKMRDIVAAPDFLKDNYLSTDARIPVTLLRTNACSPLGTNAIRGNIWNNRASETYKTLPSVGKITVQDPFTAERWQFQMPDGGLGFTRVPSLNQRLVDRAVPAQQSARAVLDRPVCRLADDLFNASIEQCCGQRSVRRSRGFDGYIVRTTERSAVYVPYPQHPCPSSSSLIHGFPTCRF